MERSEIRGHSHLWHDPGFRCAPSGLRGGETTDQSQLEALHRNDVCAGARRRRRGAEIGGDGATSPSAPSASVRPRRR